MGARYAVFSFALFALLLGAGSHAPLPVQAAGCTLSPQFAAIRDIIPYRVGDCVGDERTNPQTGRIIQNTSGGLFIHRPSDGWTAFNDGSRVWVKRPYGLSKRMVGQRFLWEPNAGGLPVVEEHAYNCVASVEPRAMYSPLSVGYQRLMVLVRDHTGDVLPGSQGYAEVRYTRGIGMINRHVDLPPTDTTGETIGTWFGDNARGYVRVTVVQHSGGCTAAGETFYRGR